MTIKRIDSHIEDRASLKFVFPGPDTDSIRILPFFENVNVKESKSAKLIKYNPIGRSSNSFGYTGADSRKLSITFNMTLPNIESIATANIDPRHNHRKKAVEEIQQSFFSKNTGAETTNTEYNAIKYEKRWREVLGEGESSRDASAAIVDSGNEEFQLLQNLALTTRSPGLLADRNEIANDAIRLKYRMIDTIVYWANLIRASVLNNAKNPFYGPPIVRLTYGVLYQDIPCVCSSYRIQSDEKAGYDQRTMLPRIISVSMDLLEVREGDRGQFSPGTPIERDNLAGWESIINGPSYSTDPMREIP